LLRRTLNLGIVAHVDAGKTTLTERLLHAAGVIDEVGSVDKGTTQTDSMPLEQQRGITIKAAVVSFELDDVTVNLIDTPGHPDFIAEVERVLSVLDGAVLVVSAVEGVQPQTRILMRALQRLHLPTLIFVNKIDRGGADADRTLEAIEQRLTAAAIAMGSASGLGTRTALFAAYGSADERLAREAREGLLYPVFFGSALTGAGVDALVPALTELLPAEVGDAQAPLSATVFKIERGPTGERIAYVRMFAGTLRTRDVLHFGSDHEGKVTAIAAFERGTSRQRPSVAAGAIAKLWGLHEVQVGDTIGVAPPRVPQREFPSPTLQSFVVPRNAEDGHRLRVALGQLAEQDPLINVQEDGTHDLTVSLYGEVQKEVIEATLATDYGLDVALCETIPIYIERPLGVGEAVELLHRESNPFLATIGLRVGPALPGSGIAFRLDVGTQTIPLFVYKTRESFAQHMEEYVVYALRMGLHGWQVEDCVVTMTSCGYSVPDGPPSQRGPLSTAADFRKLTPIVVRQALEGAGTVVCEPTERVSLEVPAQAIGAVMPALARLGAIVQTSTQNRELLTIEAVLPVTRADGLQRQLPALTGGEGVFESAFEGYEPVKGEAPTRVAHRAAAF
jgi:ribosomal protection tetracycline resistance protein